MTDHQPSRRNPYQFSLRTLFLIVLVAGVVFALLAPLMREPKWKLQFRLEDAATNGDLATVKDLLGRLGDPNGRSFDGDTAVHAAARRGHRNVVEYLLGQGANVNVRNDQRETPLHSAVRNHQLQMIKYLLEMGADKNLRDSRGRTARDWAAVFNDKEAGQLLDRVK